MLKIKDNVDLKELEKFGFKHIQKQDMIHEHYEYTIKDEDYVYPMLTCVVYCETRIIATNSKELDILFDLIQFGFVEKKGK